MLTREYGRSDNAYLNSISFEIEHIEFLTREVYNFIHVTATCKKAGDRGGTVVKLLCYKSEGCRFDHR